MEEEREVDDAQVDDSDLRRGSLDCPRSAKESRTWPLLSKWTSYLQSDRRQVPAPGWPTIVPASPTLESAKVGIRTRRPGTSSSTQAARAFRW